MTLLALVAVAYAHPSAVPHTHAADPWALATVAGWLVAGAVFLGVAHRATRAAQPTA